MKVTSRLGRRRTGRAPDDMAQANLLFAMHCPAPQHDQFVMHRQIPGHMGPVIKGASETDGTPDLIPSKEHLPSYPISKIQLVTKYGSTRFSHGLTHTANLRPEPSASATRRFTRSTKQRPHRTPLATRAFRCLGGYGDLLGIPASSLRGAERPRNQNGAIQGRGRALRSGLRRPRYALRDAGS